MVRKELILEEFGSLECFFGTLFRLREEGQGYICRHYQCEGFSYKLAEHMLRDNRDGSKMLSFLYHFASTLDERKSREISSRSLIYWVWSFLSLIGATHGIRVLKKRFRPSPTFVRIWAFWPISTNCQRCVVKTGIL